MAQHTQTIVQCTGEIAPTHSTLQQAEQDRLQQERQSEAHADTLQAQIASLQEECDAKGSQVLLAHPLFLV